MKKGKDIARYPLKIQSIRSSGQNQRFYVYVPMPLAAALGIKGGEEVDGSCWIAANYIWFAGNRQNQEPSEKPDAASRSSSPRQRKSGRYFFSGIDI